MKILEEKEKNLYKLIDKLNIITSTYSQSTYQTDKKTKGQNKRKSLNEHKVLNETKY